MKINRICHPTPSATQHTRVYGDQSTPVSSLLVERELQAFTRDWIENRSEGIFPIKENVIFSTSCITNASGNSERFREVMARLRPDDSILLFHFLTHHDEKQHLGKLNVEEKAEKIQITYNL